jgi:polysaccharide biosynthesis/export protein
LVPKRFGKIIFRSVLLACAGAVLFALIGCQTATNPPPQTSMEHPEEFSLHEGDVVKISFPGAPSLDTTQQIRRDGKITLALIGDVQAAGLRPAELEKKVAELCAPQLVSKEVSVTVISSAFPVYVSGAVLHPGKVTADRPITVLQAIMDAGGFNDSANLNAVVVVRQEGGRTRNYTVNVKAILTGKSNASFYLKPSDSVYVPEHWY